MASGLEWWNRRIKPHFKELVQSLRPVLLLDSLLEKDVIALEDYSRLQLDMQTEEDRARYLLTKVFPKCPQRTLDTFCLVLRDTRGQEHLASLVDEPSTDSNVASTAEGICATLPVADDALHHLQAQASPSGVVSRETMQEVSASVSG